MIQWQEARFEVIGKLEAKDFYRIEHQHIFSAIETLDRYGKSVDILSVTKILKKEGTLDLVGGPHFVATLTDRVAGSGNVEFWVMLIKQEFMKREMIRITGELYNRSFEDTEDAVKLIEEMAIQSQLLSEKLNFAKRESQVGELSAKTNDQVRERQISGSDGTGIKTGYKEFDLSTGGWNPTDLVLLAGRPAMGKTALALNMAVNTASLGTPTAIFSMEMSEIQVIKRIQSTWFAVNHDKVLLEKVEAEKLQEMDDDERFSKLPMYIIDEAGIEIHNLRARIITLVKKRGVRVVFIDYLQLINGVNPERPRENINIQIGYYTKTLKAVAKELNITIVLLSQLSRKVDERSKGIPRLSDLRDSGEIEQDADRVIFVYRPEYYNVKKTEPIGSDNAIFSTEGVGQMLMQKNRHGKTANFLMITELNEMRWREPNHNELFSKMLSTNAEPPDFRGTPAPVPNMTSSPSLEDDDDEEEEDLF